MKLLLELEIPPEKLVELFQRLDEDARMMAPPVSGVDEAAERRRANDRDRKRVRRHSADVSADIPQTDPSSSPEEKGFPEPLPKTQTLSPTHPPIVPPPLSAERPQVVSRRGDFEAWYARYPNKVGRKSAETAFAKAIKKTSVEALMAGLEIYTRTKPPDRSWCNPATWLNDERWLDAPAPGPTTSKRVSWV